jgi:hypothetical protein
MVEKEPWKQDNKQAMLSDSTSIQSGEKGKDFIATDSNVQKDQNNQFMNLNNAPLDKSTKKEFK